jgi:excisionase family DNA binding protein
MPIDSDYCIDRKEVARVLGISIPTVHRILRNGANGRPPLRHFRVGVAIRIRVSDLERWIASEPTPTKPVRGRPRGSTKAAMARRRAGVAKAEMDMSPTP